MAADRMRFVPGMLAIMSATIVGVAICATVVLVEVFQADKHPGATMSAIAERVGLLQLLTVQVIVVSVFVLRVLELLDADLMVSVPSGIGGYVLGNLSRPQSRGERDQSRPTTST